MNSNNVTIGHFYIRITRLAELISISFSIPINCLLLYCILTKSPKNIGRYKHLMAWFSCHSMLFSILAGLTHMSFHTMGGTIMMFTKDNYLNLPKWCMNVFLGLCCNLFGLTLFVLTLQFIYRYFAMCSPDRLVYFTGFKLLYPFFGMIVILAIYSTCAFVGSTLPYESDIKIRENLAIAYEGSPGDFRYYAVQYFTRSSKNEIIISWTMVFIPLSISVALVTMSSIIVYCGIETYEKMSKKTCNLSDHCNIQRQLFTALIVQTLTPTILIFIPCFIFYILPLFEIPLAEYSNILSISLVLYPVIDPIGVLYIIKNYRKAVKNMVNRRIRRRRRSASLYVCQSTSV